MKKNLLLLSLSACFLFAGVGCDNTENSGEPNTTQNTDEKVVSSLKVKSQPTKVEYFIGEEFDPAGCVITATYSDNSTEDIPLTDDRLEYSAPNMETEGSKNIRVRMGSAQTTFQITVVARTYDVTFDLNYDDAPEPTVVSDIKEGETVSEPEDPKRDGYEFQHWSTEKSGATVYDFDTPVTADLTLYASWITAGATTYTVTFDLNYSTAPDLPTQKIEEGKTATAVSSDTFNRKGYDFTGWYTTAAATEKFDFTTPITANTTVYAGWERNDEFQNGSRFTFEAEDVDFSGKVGNGFSGTATGTAMIMTESGDLELGASNDRFVGYLYKQGLYLDFRIASDKAVDNVKLEVRISQEYAAATYTPDMYQFSWNNQAINYEPITFTDADLSVATGDAGGQTNHYAPFRDVTLSTTISLREGTNLLRITTTNSKVMGGTMSATAPLIDCFYFTTTDNTVLDWDASRGYPFDNY